VQGKDDKGLWLPKGEATRNVRSLRATDKVWEKLNEKATGQRMTVADLIEKIAMDDSQDKRADIEQAIAILEDSLFLKPQNGGTIKIEIRKALKILKG
jgi:predicted DNA-binding ribbon-helix-helix protein